MTSATAMPSSSALWASIGPSMHVADGVDAGHAGRPVAIGLDLAAIGHLHAQRLQAQPVGVGPPPGRHQHHVGVDLCSLSSLRSL
jgi:hypothetical protein